MPSWITLANVRQWLEAPLITMSGVDVSAVLLIKLAVATAAIVVLGRAIRRMLSDRVLPGLRVEPGTAYALSNIFSYAFMTIGLYVVLDATGIKLTSLTVLFGALGVAVGFGLQEIASNFLSGLIILIERPIQVGDRVQVGTLDGRVTRINMRATEVLTNDSIAVIVPNKDFITTQVVNWSRGGDSIRVHVPIGVAYGSDLQQVRTALLEAAAAVPAVLRDPPAEVRLVNYGDSSINFELLAWTRDLLQQRLELVSRLNFAIDETFRRHGIQIPFPQRDLHIRSSVPLVVAGERER